MAYFTKCNLKAFFSVLRSCGSKSSQFQQRPQSVEAASMHNIHYMKEHSTSRKNASFEFKVAGRSKNAALTARVVKSDISLFHEVKPDHLSLYGGKSNDKKH